MILDCVTQPLCYSGVIYQSTSLGPIYTSGLICPSGFGCTDTSVLSNTSITIIGTNCSGCQGQCPSGTMNPCWYSNILTGSPKLIVTANGIFGFNSGYYPLTVADSGNSYIILYSQYNTYSFAGVISSGVGTCGYNLSGVFTPPLSYQNRFKLMLYGVMTGIFSTPYKINMRLDVDYENVVWYGRTSSSRVYVGESSISSLACSGIFQIDHINTVEFPNLSFLRPYYLSI